MLYLITPINKSFALQPLWVASFHICFEMAENELSSVNNDAEDDNPITLDDFIEEESNLVKDAIALLGSSDDKNCTYNLEYVKRQALYACITCTPQVEPTSKPAGVCLACSYHCHEGHELIELYTKRLFRCDCGNTKFSGKKCNLEPNKSEENEQNAYNQNFKGLYCTCERPYPDPEDDTPDEMVQCIICEDWYHTRHLLPGVEEPSLGTNYAEIICRPCTNRLTFLEYYAGLAVSPIKKSEGAENSRIIIDNVPESNGANEVIISEEKSIDGEQENIINGELKEDKIPDEEKTVKNEDKTVPVNSSSPNSSTALQESEESCLLKKLKPLTDDISGNNATFWPSNFRSSLCSCSSCKKVYSDLNVLWILDEADTVQAYEEEGLQKAENITTHPDKLLNNELAKFDRYQQVELIQSYNDLKSNLSEFLGKFVQQKKVVRKQDIDEFFQDMQAKKRQRVGTPPYNCH